jgi:outer membrane lipoprotein-sorting protein
MNIKRNLKIVLLSFLAFILTSSKPYQQSAVTTVFKKVAGQLSSLKGIKYHYAREFNYPSEGYLSKTEGEMYIDFGNESDLAGFRYQYSDNNGFSVFNGVEIFNGSVKDQKMRVMSQVKSRQLEGQSPLFNSIVTLRNALPGIISDQSIPKTLSDTLINNKSYYLLQFVLQNRLLNYVGTGFSSVTKELTFKYQIIADKNTFLPKTFLQTTFSSNDLNRTDFTNIKVNVALADEK